MQGQAKPKGALTPYFCFITNYQKQQRALNPSASYFELTKEGSAIWREMGALEKEPWVEASELDKLRLAREREEMEEYGYFINKDGVPSDTQHQ